MQLGGNGVCSLPLPLSGFIFLSLGFTLSFTHMHVHMHTFGTWAGFLSWGVSLQALDVAGWAET